ncbi:MAG: hypothetical protein A3E88_01980 [Legionellales bacterium RIFCSPHIGHO2_12_FULL_35_11]|nr:MAG: hypothetical protein A3E88_01980 [Legionellales bacterium RIFCSPHIGHO2_12_FULL_35_11]
MPGNKKRPYDIQLENNSKDNSNKKKSKWHAVRDKHKAPKEVQTSSDFGFTKFKPLTKDNKIELKNLVNKALNRRYQSPLEEAKSVIGAIDSVFKSRYHMQNTGPVDTPLEFYNFIINSYVESLIKIKYNSQNLSAVDTMIELNRLTKGVGQINTQGRAAVSGAHHDLKPLPTPTPKPKPEPEPEPKPKNKSKEQLNNISKNTLTR